MNRLAGTYLDRIVADVRARLGEEPTLVPGVSLRSTRSLAAELVAHRERGTLGVIAEVKRRSPSAGSIRRDVDPARQAAIYAEAGAAGISVLTERDHFSGSLDDLRLVRESVYTSVLRKDFVVDERQIIGARAAGADAVLLIAAALDDAQLADLIDAAHDHELEVLLEVHDEAELERALGSRADVIGINNRDLRSFVVDLAVTERLAPRAAEDSRPIVGESGVANVEDAARMHAAGVDALLVGEALMRAEQPGELLRALSTSGATGLKANPSVPGKGAAS